MLYVANVCCPIFISPWTTTGPNVSGFCNKHELSYPAPYNWINWQLDPIITRHKFSLTILDHKCHTPPLPILDHRQHIPPPTPFHCCFLSFRIRSHLFLLICPYWVQIYFVILLCSLHKPIHTKLLISMSTHIINLSTTIPQVLVICYPRTQLVYRKVSHHSVVA